MRTNRVNPERARHAFFRAEILPAALIVALAVQSAPLRGQVPRKMFGIKVGAITTGVDSEVGRFLNTDWRSGFSAAAFFSIDPIPVGPASGVRRPGVTLRAEVLLAQRGFGFRTYEEGTGLIPGEASLRALEVHLDVGLRLPWPKQSASVRVFAGPAVGVELSCTVEGSVRGIRFSEGCHEPVVGIKTQTLDLGFSGGGGIDFHFLPVTLVMDGRYTHGLRNLIKNPEGPERLTSRAWTFTVGLGWPF